MDYRNGLAVLSKQERKESDLEGVLALHPDSISLRFAECQDSWLIYDRLRTREDVGFEENAELQAMARKLISRERILRRIADHIGLDLDR